MSKINRVDLEVAKEVEWEGDSTQFDLALQRLSDESEFLVVNPWHDDHALQYYIEEIPKTDKCVVWHNNGKWLAKYFRKTWTPAEGYQLIEFNRPKLLWRKNPDLDKTMDFQENPYDVYTPDPYESKCELIWYIDTRFTPNQEKIWAFKCTPLDTKPVGQKHMWELTPCIDYEINQELPDFNLDIDKLCPPYFNLAHECYYKLDSRYTKDAKEQWVLKFFPLYRKPLTPICLDTFTPDLHITYNPALPRLDYDIDDFGITWEYLNYEHVWLLDRAYTPKDTDDIWTFKVRVTDDIKKEMVVDYVKPKLDPLDVVFISYNEVNAEENWQRLLALVPRAKRVDGVTGIFEAHKAAAELAESDMFFVVDGDAYIEDATVFDTQPSVFDRFCTFIWHSRNPVNGLEYGYGGVKLFPRNVVMNARSWKTLDFSTTVNRRIKVVNAISNTNQFNVDAVSTWRAAFRECVKLYASKTKENLARLEVWKTVGQDNPYGDYALKAAEQAIEFVNNNPKDLLKINDREWLNRQFKELNA
jgi:hypothetical protein